MYKDMSSRKIDSRRLFLREYDFPKTFSLTENQFSGKTYFYTIASRKTYFYAIASRTSLPPPPQRPTAPLPRGRRTTQREERRPRQRRGTGEGARGSSTTAPSWTLGWKKYDFSPLCHPPVTLSPYLSKFSRQVSPQSQPKSIL